MSYSSPSVGADCARAAPPIGIGTPPTRAATLQASPPSTTLRRDTDRFTAAGLTRDSTCECVLQSANLARKNGCNEKIITACLLHDIAVAGFIRADHGYW